MLRLQNTPKPGDADYATRNDTPRHQEKVKAVRTGHYDLVLIGDSIIHTLGELNDGKYAPNQAVWKRHFAPRRALNLGMNGQLDGDCGAHPSAAPQDKDPGDACFSTAQCIETCRMWDRLLA